MRETLQTLPHLRRPAAVNAAQYWIAPEQFARRCGRLGDRFLVPMPATGPWLCLTDPERHPARLHGRYRRASPRGGAGQDLRRTCSSSARPGLTNIDGAEHMRRRRTQLPPFQGKRWPAITRRCSARPKRLSHAGPTGTQLPPSRIMEAISAGGHHGHGVRRHRARARRTAARRDARADCRGHSRRFFLQTIIATAARTAGTGRSRGSAARSARSTRSCWKRSPSARSTDELDGHDVLGMFLRTPGEQGSLMSDERALRRDADPAAWGPRHDRLHARVDPRARQPPPRRRWPA